VVDASTETLIERFARDQDVVESSRALYVRTLRLFLNWLSEKKCELGQVDRSTIIQYKEGLLASGLSSLTVGSYLTTVRKFYEWAEANKLYPNVARGVKSPRRKQQFRRQPLTAEQGKHLLASAVPETEPSGEITEQADRERLQALRDHAITNLLLRTGLRTVELIRANVGDISLKAGKRVLKIQGKGRDEKDDFVILTAKAHEPIAAYLKFRAQTDAPNLASPKAKTTATIRLGGTPRTSLDPSAPLFVSHSNNNRDGRLTTRTIRQVVKQQMQAIGIDSPEYTAHSLRHTTAVSILRNGGSIEEAQSVLRHATPATTQIYTHTIKEEIRLARASEERLDDVF
jgi:integrase/recombinase XerD